MAKSPSCSSFLAKIGFTPDHLAHNIGSSRGRVSLNLWLQQTMLLGVRRQTQLYKVVVTKMERIELFCEDCKYKRESWV